MIAAAVSWWHYRLQALVRALDSETIVIFQFVFYVIIVIGGAYLGLAANAPPQAVEPVMGHPQYEMWLGLNVICPAMTLVGRRLSARAALIGVGEPNPAMGAAWLQLVGDGGTWSAMCIYVVCVLATTSWGTGVYAVFFVFMGVPAGAMFTLRSARRLWEIRRRGLST